MGKKESQSVVKFKENVVKWITEDGWTVEQCANEVGISLGYAYQILGAVCKEAGIDKKALLRRPHKEHAPFERTPNVPLKAMDPESFNKHCDAAIEEIDKLLAEIRVIVAEDEKLLEEEK